MIIHIIYAVFILVLAGFQGYFMVKRFRTGQDKYGDYSICLFLAVLTLVIIRYSCF